MDHIYREQFLFKLTSSIFLTFFLCWGIANRLSCSDIYNQKCYEYLDLVSYSENDNFNSPSKESLTSIKEEAESVMEDVINILEKGKCFKVLSDDIDESQQSLEEWVKRTWDSQTRIGGILKAHPNIYCVSLRVSNFRRIINKYFKQINIMWLMLPRSNKCMIIVFPNSSYVSLYGAVTSLEKDNVIEVGIENIPLYFIEKERSGQYPDFIEEIKEIQNDENLLETIIRSHSMLSFESKGSKGMLIYFTKKVKHKGHRFWADGIRTYFTYNYTPSKNERQEPECPKNIYGKPYCVCLTFDLGTQ